MGRMWRGRPVSVRLTPSANENLQVITLTGVGGTGGGLESRRKPKKIKDEELRVEESSRRGMARGSEE